MNRKAILALVLAAMVVMTVAGARLSAAPAFPPAPPPGLPVVRSNAVNQVWYCALGTGVTGGQADAVLALANPGPATVRGIVTVYPNQGHVGRRPFTLGPWSRALLREASVAPGPFVAATVSFTGGGGAVDQQVSGPLGTSATGCATSPSPNWYFADGTTQTGASLVVGLFNPFPEGALADLSFADNQGPARPAAFQGIYVAPHSLLSVDVGQHVVEVPDIATTVRVRVGRLVASELQLDGAAGRQAVSLNTGAPAPQHRWLLPDGVVAPGVGDQIHVYDPGPSPAQVEVRLRLTRGTAAPFELRLDPGSETSLDLARQPRVPYNDPYWVQVTAAGGAVVVQRRVTAGPPSSRLGTAGMLAAPSVARAWVLAAGGTTATQDEWVEVLDPGSRPATVRFMSLSGAPTAVPGLTSLVVPPGGRAAVRVGGHFGTPYLSLLVRSSRSVVVERDLYQVGAPGVSLALGEPLEGSPGSA